MAKLFTIVVLLFCFITGSLAQSEGCLALSTPEECAEGYIQSPIISRNGPGRFNELETITVCANGCENSCPTGEAKNATFKLLLCDPSSGTKGWIGGFDNDTCLNWGYGPGVVVQEEGVMIPTSGCDEPVCSCMYIPEAEELGLDDISEYEFAIVVEGIEGVSLQAETTCPSQCNAPPPVFNGQITTAAVTTINPPVLTTSNPNVPSSDDSSENDVPVGWNMSSSSSDIGLILALTLGFGLPCCLLLFLLLLIIVLCLSQGKDASSNTFWLSSRS
jgi:hypothetical protein